MEKWKPWERDKLNFQEQKTTISEMKNLWDVFKSELREQEKSLVIWKWNSRYSQIWKSRGKILKKE